MGFFEAPGVPFDSNKTEPDLRMMKVSKKKRGTFRSEEHAGAFCDLRDVSYSAAKQGCNVSDTSVEWFRWQPVLGETLALPTGE
jgi:hypothetical protein